MKKIYDTTRLLSGKRTVQNTPVKDKNGVVLTRTDDQLNRRKESFQEILNRPAPENPPDLTVGPALGIGTGPITMAEVKNALKNMKNGKVAGCDTHIPPRSLFPPLSLEQDLDYGGRSSGLEARPPGQASQER